MKKLLLATMSLSLLISCQETPKTEPVAEATPVVVEPEVSYPFKAMISDFKIGNPQNTVKVMEMYKILEAGTSIDSLLLPYFADTVTSVAFDQREFRGPASVFVKKVSAFRGQFKSINEEFMSHVSLHSDEKDLDVVSVWFKERAIRLNGKPDSTLYQENWRFNKEGKIYYRAAFARYGF
jgi:phosphatidylserine decarboxylase